MFYENKESSFFIVNETNPLDYPLHVHQYIELVHVVQGHIKMNVGSRQYSIIAGELAIIFPNIPHDYHTLSPEGDTQLHIMNCYLDLIPMYKKQLLEKYPETPVLSVSQIHEDILYAKRRLFEAVCAPLYSSSELISALVTLILSRIFPELNLKNYTEQPPQDLTCDIIAYISKHYTESLSLSSVSARFGIGKYTLSRIFSTILKINFVQYINSLRINYAKYLLINTDLNIINVAVECGYHNQQTFNRIFKEFCRCTPKEFRKINSIICN